MQNANLSGLQLLWSSRVEAFKSSSLTQAEFCKVNEYKVKQFNYWFRKFKNIKTTVQTKNPGWISVNVTAPVRNDLLTVRIGSVEIDVNPRFNKHLLAEVVEALSKLC